jgi:hypothetical protein
MNHNNGNLHELWVQWAEAKISGVACVEADAKHRWVEALRLAFADIGSRAQR